MALAATPRLVGNVAVKGSADELITAAGPIVNPSRRSLELRPRKEISHAWASSFERSHSRFVRAREGVIASDSVGLIATFARSTW